jgi:arabinofuranosyltransferase
MAGGRRLWVYALCAIAAVALVLHSLVWNFVTDDAFISFVYSRNLARHGQLVFNLGERVEGYTNFLWTVLLAGLLKIGLAPELMSRLLGTAAGVATLFVCTRASRTLRGDSGWSPWDALPALLLAGVPGFACWSSGGLETMLFTLLVTVGATQYLAHGPARGSALAFGLSALTRPEGLLFFALTGLHLTLTKLVQKKLAPTRKELAWVGLFLLLVVPHLLWRRWYYGWWLPNTFYIKSSGLGGVWSQGGFYLLSFTLQFHLYVVPLLVAAGLIVRRDRAALKFVGYVALVTAVFLTYVASVGGDFMGLFRFAMPIVPLLALSAATGLRLMLADRRPALQVAVVVALLCGHAAHAVAVDKKSLTIGADRGIDTPGYLRWYTADRAAIGKWFGQYAQPDDYAAVGGAGAQVWYSGIRSLDCFGLSDAYIAHNVPAGSSRPGHQKYAPEPYILSKKPTIITSYNYRITHAPYVGPDEAMWRQRGYHYVSVQVPGLSSPWYAFLLRNDRTLGPLKPLELDREP